jgi:hypothetical protein
VISHLTPLEKKGVSKAKGGIVGKNCSKYDLWILKELGRVLWLLVE